MNQKLKIVVIEGTTRVKRESINAAKLIADIGNKIEGIETQLVDVANFEIKADGNDAENLNPEWTNIRNNADAFFIVVPEYNHSVPGSLKIFLDNSDYKGYIHKPVAFAGVSSGPWGGVRGIEALNTAIRETGLVALSIDVQFPFIQNLFDDNGKLLDDAYVHRVEKIYKELIWMAKCLKYGRENIK